MEKITFDKYGRMNFHPHYHHNHGMPWTTTDQQYLIEYYDIKGAEQISLSLGRTIHTIMTRVYELRRKGLMAKPEKRKHFRRLLQSKTVKVFE